MATLVHPVRRHGSSRAIISARVSHLALVALAAVFSIVGLIAGLVGLLFVTRAASAADKWRGALLVDFGLVFVLAAVGLFASTRAGSRKPPEERPIWSRGSLVSLSCPAIALTIVGLVKSYTSRVAAFDAQAAWFPYALTLGFALLGLLYFQQPFAPALLRWAAVAMVACAVVLSTVGLIVGLQGHGDYYNHGAGWLLSATVASVLAAAAFFGTSRPKHAALSSAPDEK